MRILLIEDDMEICLAVQAQLVSEGYETDICTDGEEALFYASRPSYDAIILDRMLPGMDGISILKAIRNQKIYTPIILATALGSVEERIQGLDLGADDYIIKPYDIKELSARIRALVRRPSSIRSSSNLCYEDLTLIPSERTLSSGKKTLRLSKRETALMEYLLKNPETIIPRELVFSHVWGPGSEVEDGNLDNYIYFLRKRLKMLESKTEIETVHRTGYRLKKEKGDS